MTCLCHSRTSNTISSNVYKNASMLPFNICSILVLDLLGHRLVNGKRVLLAMLEQAGGHRSWYMSRFCSKTDLGILVT